MYSLLEAGDEEDRRSPRSEWSAFRLSSRVSMLTAGLKKERLEGC